MNFSKLNFESQSPCFPTQCNSLEQKGNGWLVSSAKDQLDSGGLSVVESIRSFQSRGMGKKLAQ